MCHDVGHTSDSSPSPQEREKPLTVENFEKSNQSPRNMPHITTSPNNGHNSASRLADAGIRTMRENISENRIAKMDMLQKPRTCNVQGNNRSDP